jgi:hypothetical protein
LEKPFKANRATKKGSAHRGHFYNTIKERKWRLDSRIGWPCRSILESSKFSTPGTGIQVYS